MDTGIIEQPKTDFQIIESKRDAWGRLGISIYKSELKLQLRAQQATAKLASLPLTLEDIPEAENILKEVKAEQCLIVEDRKKITSRFDEVKARLMIPENSFTTPLNEYSNAIIKIKQEKEKKDREKKAKEDELSRIRHQLNSAVAKYDAEFKTLIAEKVNQAFMHALEKNIHPGQECDDYIDRVNFKVKESWFPIDRVSFNGTLLYTSKEEYEQILFELSTINPSAYVALFATEMEKRFSDYNVAYNNREQAIELSRKEQEEKLKQIEEEKQSRVVSSELDSVATDMSVEPSNIKALKKCYEVDMPETFDNAMTIFRAFMANKQKCLEKVNITKWFAFNAGSAAKALSKLKSEDNNFNPVGISFKEIDKL